MSKFTGVSKLGNTVYTEANGTNFPCLKHFFKCNESVGSTTLTDNVGGVVLPIPNNTSAVAYTVDPGTIVNVTPSSGTLVTIGSTSTLIFSIFKAVSGDGISLGNNTGARLSISDEGGALSDGTISVNTVPLYIYQFLTRGVGVMVDFSNTPALRADVLDNNGVYNDTLDTPLSGITNITNSNTISIDTGVSTLYGIAIFQFQSGIPLDVHLAEAWMMAKWTAGIKEIYPGWVGVN